MVIARACVRGRGGAFIAVGLVLLLFSAVVHANPYHIAASLLVALGVWLLRVLGRIDESLLSTPWHHVVAATDGASLLVLGAATFSPLLVIAAHGEPGWDLMVLGGILLVWWNVMDLLVADHRRVFGLLAVVLLAWLPVALWHPPTWKVAYASAALGLIATGFTAVALRRSLTGIPRQYRRIQVQRED